VSAFSKSSVVKYEFNEEIKDGFPLIIDDTTMAFHMYLRCKTLWYLIHKRNKMQAYKCFTIPQYNPDGTIKKRREIQEPMPHLKRVHSSLNRMFSKVTVDDAISAYVKGRNCSDAAKKHVRKSASFPDAAMVTDSEGNTATSTEENLYRSDPRYSLVNTIEHSHDPESTKIRKYHQPICMIKMDIKNFFPSIKASWIREYFVNEVGYSHYVASLMATLCSVKRKVKNPAGKVIEIKHLPQGSPLSGSLSNLIGFHRFGKKIKNMLEAHSSDWVFTIYSDDIIITHPSNTLTEEEAVMIKDKMHKIITDSGFVVNEKKTLIKWSYRDKIKILGCIVTDKLNVPKQVRNKLASRIHNCKTKGFDSQCSENQTALGLVAYLQGMIEYVRSIRSDLADKFTEELKEAMLLHDLEMNPDHLEGVLLA